MSNIDFTRTMRVTWWRMDQAPKGHDVPSVSLLYVLLYGQVDAEWPGGPDNFEIGCWDDDEKCWLKGYDNERPLGFAPTHWQPLEPPVSVARWIDDERGYEKAPQN